MEHESRTANDEDDMTDDFDGLQEKHDIDNSKAESCPLE
jgi:hypothetical protein